jgi:alpha-L-fucosidase 2
MRYASPILLLCIPLLWTATPAAAAVDWPTFLARNDMVWPTLPDGWDTAPFVGNGRLGAILWQEKDGAFHVEVSRSDLYDHRRLSAGLGVLFEHERLPDGYFTLAFGPPTAVPTGDMRLDLWNAEARGHVTAGSQAYTLRCLAHAGSDVLVLETTGADGAEPPRLEWHPEPAKSTRNLGKPVATEAYPPPTMQHLDGCDVSVQEMPADARYHTDGLGVGQYATAWKTLDLGHGHRVTLVALEASYPGRTAVRHAVDLVLNAERDGIDHLTATHRNWWHAYYPKSFLSLPNASVESFYWVQLYKMGSASRDGGPILDLMGPWFRTTTWPAIWWNLNVQLTYWPFYASNHVEDATPLGRTLWDARRALAANAAPYSADSYAIGRATAPDCEDPVGHEVGNLPWAMHNLWLQYRYTMDDAYLRQQLFPLMKGTFRYLRHIAVQRPDGSLALPPTASPEYTDAAPDCSYTLSCFRWLATTIIAADGRLQAHDPIVADCRDVLARLVPYPVDPATGVMVGAGIPFAHSHRHWSHLFMIYPFREWDWNDPARRPLMERSLDNWTSKPAGFAGFSWVGAAAMSAESGDGDRALGYLTSFLKKSPLPNTLYREGSPVMETPLAFARSVQELLLDSHGDAIRVFPAVPAAWPDVAFADLRTEGAFLITADRRGGATRFVTVTSLAGEPCHIDTGLPGPVTASPATVAGFRDLGHGVVEMRPPAGTTVTLSAGPAPVDTSVAPVARTGPFTPWGRQRGVP